MTAIDPVLLQRVDAQCESASLRATLLRHLEPLGAQVAPGRLSLAIHPRDQMLTHSLRQHGDADWALSQYFAVALQQYGTARQIARSLFGAESASLDVLDFACGYGRMLRFLAAGTAPARLWGAEIQADAVAFVRDALGVQALLSAADPAQFEPGRRFDLIWVASLFSHLPEALFHAWLARLAALLTPRGVLAFSVRDLGHWSGAAPAQGFVYARESENADLDGDIYGTAYADADFVARAVRGAVGHANCRRLPKALAHEQDVYVLAADGGRDLAALDGFRRGPWGWLDRKALDREGRLYLEGWAASLDDGQVAEVEVRVDEVVHRCVPHKARPDVAAAFGDARMGESGWELRLSLPARPLQVEVEIGARSARGETALLFAGRLDAG